MKIIVPMFLMAPSNKEWMLHLRGIVSPGTEFTASIGFIDFDAAVNY
jgi:hypothetical protein